MKNKKQKTRNGIAFALALALGCSVAQKNENLEGRINPVDSIKTVSIEGGMPQYIDASFDYDSLSTELTNYIGGYVPLKQDEICPNMSAEEIYNLSMQRVDCENGDCDYEKLASLVDNFQIAGYLCDIRVKDADGMLTGDYITTVYREGKSYVFCLNKDYEESVKDAKYYLEFPLNVKILYQSKKDKK